MFAPSKILILLSLLVFAAVWVARWWFWWRMRVRGQRVECSMTVGDLCQKLEVPRKKGTELRDAASLGSALRDCGLRLLERDGVVMARKRRTGWWSLRILPGLVAVVVVFASVTKRVAPHWMLAAGMALIALHIFVRVSGIGIELRAVNRAFEELGKKGGLRRMSEEEAVLDCARASVWDTVLPW